MCAHQYELIFAPCLMMFGSELKFRLCRQGPKTIFRSTGKKTKMALFTGAFEGLYTCVGRIFWIYATVGTGTFLLCSPASRGNFAASRTPLSSPSTQKHGKRGNDRAPIFLYSLWRVSVTSWRTAGHFYFISVRRPLMLKLYVLFACITSILFRTYFAKKYQGGHISHKFHIFRRYPHKTAHISKRFSTSICEARYSTARAHISSICTR